MSIVRTTTHKSSRRVAPGEKAKDRDVSPQAAARRAETCRLRVETAKLIERVQKHAMGKVQMSPTQLAAAQTLLRKTLPDLVGVKAELDISPVTFNFNMHAHPKEG